MKKWVCLALAVITGVSLIGCSNSPESTSGTVTAAPSAGVEGGDKAAAGYEPSGTLTIVVPYAAGGAVDLGSRLLAKYLSEYSSTDVIVSNVAGGGGTVGAADVLKYNADGSYMLALNPSPTYVSTKDKPLTFDILKDYAFCAMMVQDQRLYVGKSDNSNFSTVEEAIEYGKANPKKFNVGCSGSGNTSYLAAQQFLTSTGIEGNIVPFDGAAEAKSALLGGHIDLAVLALSEYAASANELMAIATGGEERFDKMPEVPCMTELGYPMANYVTRGYAMKAGTDEAIMEYWSQRIGEVCTDERFLKEAEELGLPIVYMDYKTAQACAEEEMALYREVFGE